jgi:hypothetical protein
MGTHGGEPLGPEQMGSHQTTNWLSRFWSFGSEPGGKACLFAELVCGDAVELSMPLDRDNLGSVCVD